VAATDYDDFEAILKRHGLGLRLSDLEKRAQVYADLFALSAVRNHGGGEGTVSSCTYI
jgi:hypothetical protein